MSGSSTKKVEEQDNEIEEGKGLKFLEQERKPIEMQVKIEWNFSFKVRA